MIDKHELRIGNIVPLWKGQIGVIKELHHDVAFVMWNSVVHVMFYKDISPIELTEDILLKWGFEKHDNGSLQSDINYGITLWSKNGSVVRLYYESDEFGQEIETLHHLQNLYFALTGKELQIDLK